MAADALFPALVRIRASVCLLGGLFAGQLAAAGPPLTRAVLPDPVRGRLEDHIQAELRLNEIPGAAVAVVQEGQLVYARGFGVKDLATGERMTVDTPVEIASLSKSFTALAILRLEQEGRLQRERPLWEYLPRFSAGAEDPPITIAQLLEHRSGLTRRADWLVPCCGHPGDLDLKVAVERLRKARPVAGPGQLFRYSNSNYVLLAALVESVSGEPFPAFMTRYVFAPLGLTRTTLSVRQAREWGLARLHERQWGRMRPSPSTYTGWYGASKVKSTAADLAKYMRILLEEGLEGISVRSLCRGAEEHYRMGWEIVGSSRLGEPCMLRHSGTLVGINTAMALLPERRVGAVVLLNAGVTRAEPLVEAVLALVLGQTPQPPAAPRWLQVPDNWALLFTGAALLTLGLWVLYLKGVARELRSGERRLWTSRDGWNLLRALLFFSMAASLSYLIARGPGPPWAALPVSIQVSFPLFAGSLAMVFLTLSILSLSARHGPEV